MSRLDERMSEAQRVLPALTYHANEDRTRFRFLYDGEPFNEEVKWYTLQEAHAFIDALEITANNVEVHHPDMEEK